MSKWPQHLLTVDQLVCMDVFRDVIMVVLPVVLHSFGDLVAILLGIF